MGFREDKQARTEHYFKYVYGWKQRKCGACAGSGWYDDTDKDGNSIPCSCCEGTGKERYKSDIERSHKFIGVDYGSKPSFSKPVIIIGCGGRNSGRSMLMDAFFNQLPQLPPLPPLPPLLTFYDECSPYFPSAALPKKNKRNGLRLVCGKCGSSDQLRRVLKGYLCVDCFKKRGEE